MRPDQDSVFMKALNILDGSLDDGFVVERNARTYLQTLDEASQDGIREAIRTVAKRRGVTA